MRSPQASRSIVRVEWLIKVYFLYRKAIDSSMVSPLTHTEGLPSCGTRVEEERDVHDDNGNEPLRTRRRHSPDTWHDHFGLPGVTCKAVRRRRGRACVAPRLRWASGGADLTLSGHSVSVCR